MQIIGFQYPFNYYIYSFIENNKWKQSGLFPRTYHLHGTRGITLVIFFCQSILGKGYSISSFHSNKQDSTLLCLLSFEMTGFSLHEETYLFWMDRCSPASSGCSLTARRPSLRAQLAPALCPTAMLAPVPSPSVHPPSQGVSGRRMSRWSLNSFQWYF